MITLYKHIAMRDVAMEVLYRDGNRVEISWWNIGKCHRPWPMGITQELVITPDKWKDWEVYETL